MKKKIVALDIGDKRIGVAVTDPFGEYAIPCETYVRQGKLAVDVDAVLEIAKDKGAQIIVCGLPVNFDGSPALQTEKTERFIDEIKKRTSLEVDTEDERFTTKEARAVQIAGGVKGKDKKKTIDSIAASYILDGYLARKNKEERRKIMEENKELDEEEEGIVEIEDEDGNTIRLYHLATIEYKGGKYCCFQNAEPETEEEEDEVDIYRLVEEGDDARLDPIEDDQLLDEVFAEFCREYEEADNGDARSLDED